jgi:hypothetical protein
MDGNLGMLGRDYPGYFETGNEHELAALMRQIETDPDFGKKLARHCKQQAPKFKPAKEINALRRLLAELR